MQAFIDSRSFFCSPSYFGLGPIADIARWRAGGPHQYVSLAMGVDPGDDFWPVRVPGAQPEFRDAATQPQPRLDIE
jgi:hypothetical protein